MLVVLFVGLVFLFEKKPTGFIPPEDEGRVYVTYQMPEAASTYRSVDMLKEIMKRVQTIPEVGTVGGLAGVNIISSANQTERRNYVCFVKTMG